MTEDLKKWPTAADVSPGQFEIAKWIALAAMACDHFGKIVMPEFFMVGHFFGRLSFPIFTWIIACRLVARPELARVYLVWMVPFAFLAQPIFVYAGQEIWFGNIFFTLALGVGSIRLWQKAKDLHLSLALSSAVLIVVVSTQVDYGPPGVALILGLHLIAQRNVYFSALWLGPLAVLVNVSWSSLLFTWAGGAALFSGVVAYATLRFNVTLPRAPKLFFYGFYPAHLLLFTLIAIYFFEL